MVVDHFCVARSLLRVFRWRCFCVLGLKPILSFYWGLLVGYDYDLKSLTKLLWFTGYSFCMGCDPVDDTVPSFNVLCIGSSFEHHSGWVVDYWVHWNNCSFHYFWAFSHFHFSISSLLRDFVFVMALLFYFGMKSFYFSPKKKKNDDRK